MIKLQHKCRGCGIFVPEGELYSPDDPDDPQALLLCKGCYMGHFATESFKGEGTLEPCPHERGIDSEEVSWLGEGDGVVHITGRCSDCGAEGEGYVQIDFEDGERWKDEVFESDESFEAESSKRAAPVEVINNRAGFFDEKQDREYFGFGFIAGGILVAVFGTILGNILSELVLDEMRVNKFGYRSNEEKGSFWKLGE